MFLKKTPLRLSPRKTGLMRNSMLRSSKKSRSQINNLDSPCPPGRQIKIWSLGNQVSAPISRARSHNFEEWDSRVGGRCVIIFINFKSDPLSFFNIFKSHQFPSFHLDLSYFPWHNFHIFWARSKGKKMISISLFATPDKTVSPAQTRGLKEYCSAQSPEL